MLKILLLFAHPALEKSRIHKRMIAHVQRMPGITFHDLYEAYPDFDIDVGFEQQLLLEHELIIFQHPFYWYSAPAIIKQWQDLVLEHGWAYGREGTRLAGKKTMNAISCGGSREVYRSEGRNRFTVPHFLAPFDQTARLCRMEFLPPFVVHGTHRLNEADIELCAVQYEQLLAALTHQRISPLEWSTVEYMNDLVPIPLTIQS